MSVSVFENLDHSRHPDQAIAEALKPFGVGVATGEVAQNKVIFKQLLQEDAIEFCQIDSCRIAGPVSQFES